MVFRQVLAFNSPQSCTTHRPPLRRSSAPQRQQSSACSPAAAHLAFDRLGPQRRRALPPLELALDGLVGEVVDLLGVVVLLLLGLTPLRGRGLRLRPGALLRGGGDGHRRRRRRWRSVTFSQCGRRVRRGDSLMTHGKHRVVTVASSAYPTRIEYEALKGSIPWKHGKVTATSSVHLH